MCLATNVWHEARGEPMEGEVAVALVTVNRSRRRGTSVCHEVYRPHQFSWTLSKGERRAVPKGPSWRRAVMVARAVLIGGMGDFTGGATHYHREDILPYWARTLDVVGQWGDHIFYRPRRR